MNAEKSNMPYVVRQLEVVRDSVPWACVGNISEWSSNNVWLSMDGSAVNVAIVSLKE